MTNKPFLTIILPVFNGEKTITGTLGSIHEQTFHNLEVLIMDGGSTDRTVDLVQSLNLPFSMRLFSQRDKGVYDAMNKGIELARGEWVLFLGADDRLHDKDVLKKFFHQHEADSDLVYGDILFEKRRKRYAGKFNRWKILDMNISHQAMFYRKELFTRFGKYDLSFPLLADYAFNLQLFARRDVKKQYLPMIVSVFGEEGLSSTSRDPVFKKARTRLVREFYPLPFYLYAVLIVPWIHLIRKSIHTPPQTINPG